MEKKEKREEIVFCPFCKQSRMVVRDKFEFGVDESMIGAIYCDYVEAKRFQAKKKSKDGLDKIIGDFAGYAGERNIEVKGEAISAIRAASVAVIDEQMGSVSFRLSSLTVKLSLDKDGALKFGVVYKSGYSQLT